MNRQKQIQWNADLFNKLYLSRFSSSVQEEVKELLAKMLKAEMQRRRQGKDKTK